MVTPNGFGNDPPRGPGGFGNNGGGGGWGSGWGNNWNMNTIFSLKDISPKT